MIDLSLAGLLGAVVGTIAAALVYGPLVAAVERGFRSRDTLVSEQELSMLRRGVLAVDLLVLAGIGYWLGERIGG